MAEITQKRLKEVISYDPHSGLFTWLITSGGAVSGNIAGGYIGGGYIGINVDKKQYLAHRLAFMYENGRFPAKNIDHINGIRDDNRLINLREATSSENQQNQRRPQKHNRLGVLGVIEDRRNGRFIAQITINGKVKKLGSFSTTDLAHQAYIDAKRANHPFNTL